jgi:hypothetical protein
LVVGSDRWATAAGREGQRTELWDDGATVAAAVGALVATALGGAVAGSLVDVESLAGVDPAGVGSSGALAAAAAEGETSGETVGLGIAPCLSFFRTVRCALCSAVFADWFSVG